MDIQQEPEYLTILRERVASLGSNQAVADELCVSRTAVSLLLAGKYTGGTEQVATRIVEHYTDRVHCPHVSASISKKACASNNESAAPVSDPQKLRQWAACRLCPRTHDQEVAQ